MKSIQSCVYTNGQSNQSITEYAFSNQRIKLHHETETRDIENVGLQLWMGSLLLADYILHVLDLKDKIIVEIGAGTGLISILCALQGCQHVLVTDIPPVLDLLQRNVSLNHTQEIISVLEWNINDMFPIKPSVKTRLHPYAWTRTDHDLFKQCEIVFASDIIYKDDVTFGFVSHLVDLLFPNRILYLSIEKRIQFTLQELKESAPAWEYFINTVDAMNAQNASMDLPCIMIEKLDMSLLPRSLDYQRSDELELYKIFLIKSDFK